MLTKWVLHWWHRFRLSLDYLSMRMMDYLSSRHFIKVQLMLPCSSIYSRATEDSFGFTWCIWFYLVSKYHKVKYKKCDITCTIKNFQLDRFTKKELWAQFWVFHLYSFIEIEMTQSPNMPAIQKCLYKKSHHTPLQEPLSVCVGQLPSEELYYKCGKKPKLLIEYYCCEKHLLTLNWEAAILSLYI